MSKTALLELGEMDLKTNETEMTLKTTMKEPIHLDDQLAHALGKGTWKLSKKLQHAAQTHSKGQFKLFPNGNAMEIGCAVHGNNSYYLLCKELTKKKQFTHGFSSWTCETGEKNLKLLPLELVSQCDTATLKRIECKDTHKDIWLLMG